MDPGIDVSTAVRILTMIITSMADNEGKDYIGGVGQRKKEYLRDIWEVKLVDLVLDVEIRKKKFPRVVSGTE